ncbi:MAG: trypsin-like peptidase domain-containing protein [Deltaproteobacteria bacterium]|nr:trypsin-like peptidase domain-containing protein [Deltaproteobacteria bacterium]
MSFRNATGLFILAGLLSACAGEAPVPGQDGYLPTSPQDDDSLHEWLVQEEAATRDVMRIQVTPDEIEALHTNDEPRLKVGVVKDLDVTIDLTSNATDGLRIMEAGFVWSGVVESFGAGAMQLQFTDFSLPEGADLYLYNDYGEVFGPYTDSGAFWSPNLRSDHVYLQVHYKGPDTTYGLQEMRLTLGKVSHVSPKFMTQKKRPKPPAGNLCSYNEVCVQDAADSDIWPAIEDAQYAVAAYTFVVPNEGTYICSGGLIADEDPTTDRPFFLTANHCVGDADLGSVTAYFHYRIDLGEDCDYWPAESIVGSQAHTMSANADYALIELTGVPAGVKFMPWTDVVPEEGDTLYRISHPAGAPQAYSEQKIETTFGFCGTLPMPNFLYSQDIFGATEGGSSGSPVYDASGQIVGQLYGSCGYNNEPCDAVDNRTVDGSIAYWADELSAILAQAGCTSNAQCDNGDACDGAEECVSGSCVPGDAVDCDDDDACTEDVCDPETGSCDNTTEIVCDDGDDCNGDETCDPAAGCQSGPPVDCDDGDACTEDTCDPLNGACSISPVDCDDGDGCTEDTCDTVSGCSNIDNPDLSTCDTCGERRDWCDSNDDCCSNRCDRRKHKCR